jgi:mRNA-degrading endonuclease RelE of RelBE toxin-antitoxin system
MNMRVFDCSASLGRTDATGDIKPLTDELEGFYRLRVGSHRVVFEYQIIEGSRVITCVFAGPRKWIYEVFQSRLLE